MFGRYKKYKKLVEALTKEVWNIENRLDLVLSMNEELLKKLYIGKSVEGISNNKKCAFVIEEVEFIRGSIYFTGTLKSPKYSSNKVSININNCAIKY